MIIILCCTNAPAINTMVILVKERFSIRSYENLGYWGSREEGGGQLKSNIPFICYLYDSNGLLYKVKRQLRYERYRGSRGSHRFMGGYINNSLYCHIYYYHMSMSFSCSMIPVNSSLSLLNGIYFMDLYFKPLYHYLKYSRLRIPPHPDISPV